MSVHQFHTIENSHPNRAYLWASHGTFMYLGSSFHFCTWKVQEIRRTPIQLMEAKIQARTPTPDMKFNTSCFSLKPFPRLALQLKLWESCSYWYLPMRSQNLSERTHLNNYAYTRMDIGKLTQRIGSPDKPIPVRFQQMPKRNHIAFLHILTEHQTATNPSRCVGWTLEKTIRWTFRFNDNLF